jgi:hypothetical protein
MVCQLPLPYAYASEAFSSAGRGIDAVTPNARGLARGPIYPHSAHCVRATNWIRSPNLLSLWMSWMPALGKSQAIVPPLSLPALAVFHTV